MKNKLNIIIFILMTLCIGLAIYLLFFSGSTTKSNPTITIQRKTIVLKVGEEQVIKPIVTDLDDYTLEWSSSDNNIATVIDGKVTAINKGSSVVTVKIKDYDVFDKVNVIVNEVEPESIKLDVNTLELTVDDTYEFSYTLLPNNVTNNEVRWEVSDNSLVEFDNGKLKAIKSGVLSIRVIASNGIKDTCNILIKDKSIPVEDIVIEKDSYELEVGDSITIKPTILPSNATNKDLLWESSDSSIATVSNGVIKAKKEGTVTITVSDSTKQKTKKIKITIKLNDQKIHFIWLSKYNATLNGDAIVLESKGHFAMIDTGIANNTDRKHIYNYLKSIGVKKLDFILITHIHDDHSGGLIYLLDKIEVGRLYIKTYLGKDEHPEITMGNYNSMIAKANEKKVPITYIDKKFKDGEGFNFQDMEIKLYNTQQIYPPELKGKQDENANTVIQLIKVNGYRILLTGDLEAWSNNISLISSLSKNNLFQNLDLVKTPHHGFNSCAFQNNQEAAKRMNPKYVVNYGSATECQRYFPSSSERIYTRESKKDAVVFTFGDKITIDK